MPIETQESLKGLRNRFGTRPVSELAHRIADEAANVLSLQSDETAFGSDGFDAEGYDRAGFDLLGVDRFGYRWAGREGPEEFVFDRSGKRIPRSEAMRRHSDSHYALRRYFYGKLDIEELLSCRNPAEGLSHWMDELRTLNDPESHPDTERRKLARTLAERLGVLWELDAVMNSALDRAIRLDSEKKKNGEKPWVEKSGKPYIVYNRNG